MLCGSGEAVAAELGGDRLPAPSRCVQSNQSGILLKNFFVAVAVSFVGCFPHPSAALTLGEAVERALQNDPVYLGAQANLWVSQARSRQALSALMPQLTASANTTFNRRDYSQHSLFGMPANVRDAYNSNSAQLNLTQPLWRRNSFIAMRQADMVMAQSDQQLRASGQDLLVRLAQTWLDIMQARDAVSLAKSQLQLARLQYTQAFRASDKGVVSVVEAELANGRYELAVAGLSSAEAEQSIRFAALEQIIGAAEMSVMPVLPEDAAMPDWHASSLEHWMEAAEEYSPSILAARHALDAAIEEVRRQSAGHDPTLDVVASYGRAAQGAGISGGQAGFDSKTGSVGLQLSVPLFAGGGQSARVREASALKEKAVQDFELATRNVRSAVKQAWFTWLSGDARRLAARQNVISTSFALKGVEQERMRGVKAGLDVLQASAQYESAMRDCHKAQYDSFMSYFKLLAAAGQLTAEELVRMGRLFR